MRLLRSSPCACSSHMNKHTVGGLALLLWLVTA